MATEGDNDFTHQIAILLSRALNLVNPNDLLARRVQDIAKTNTVDGFISGAHSSSFWYSHQRLTGVLAAKSFGKFKDSFLAELHAEILSHGKQEAAGNEAQPVQGIVVHDSDVLEPEPVRQGGLVRKDAVSNYLGYEQFCSRGLVRMRAVCRGIHSSSPRNLWHRPHPARLCLVSIA